MDFKDFIGGSNESQAATADQQKTVNWYPELLDVGGSTRPSALYPTPGVTSLDSSAVTGKARAHVVIPCGNGNCVESQAFPEHMPPFLTDGREFLVIGNTLYEANSAGNLTEFTSTSAGPDNAFEGSVNPSTSTEPATIHSGFDPQKDVFLTSHGVGYYFGMTGSPTQTVDKISDLDGINIAMGAFLDGFWLGLDTDNSKFYVSNLNDLNTWDTGTDFAGRSLASDPWRSMIVYGRYVWLFGERTTEIWQDTGDRFPFAPIPSALINYGIAAPWSAKIVDNSLVWLARSEAGRICVVRANGINIETISTRPVELAINSYSDYGDARADTYSEAGHDFYVLHFDNSDATHVWDAKSNLWHERGTWDSAARKFTALRQRFPVYAFRELRCLDSGKDQPVGSGNPSQLYQMGISHKSDVGGGVIRRVRRAPALQAENRRIFYSKFELDLEPGLGLTSGQGEDPQVMLRTSNDGGKTWGSEVWRGAGKLGEYEKRVRWLRLGSGRRRVFEVAVTDPIPWRLTGAYLSHSLEGGA